MLWKIKNVMLRLNHGIQDVFSMGFMVKLRDDDGGKNSYKRDLLNTQGGFSLIEAIVATAIMGVGFAGSFTLTSITKNSSDEAVARQKLQMVSNQIFEVIETDLSNIDSYDMGLTVCNVPAGGETDKFDLRQYEWCMRMNNELGAATGAETRQIDVTTLGDGRKVVHVELEARRQKVQIVMKRIYDD